MAGRLSELKIDTVCSSPFARAKEMAEIIGDRLKLPISYLPEVVEIKRPDFLYDHSYFSLATLHYLWLLFKNKRAESLECGQAESLLNLSQRVHAAKETLSQVPGQRVAVVSHAVFMNIFVSLVCFDNDLNRWRFIGHLYQTMGTKNTTIFHLHYDRENVSDSPPWRLVKKIDRR